MPPNLPFGQKVLPLIGYVPVLMIGAFTSSLITAIIAGIFGLVGIGLQIHFSRKVTVLPHENAQRIEEVSAKADRVEAHATYVRATDLTAALEEVNRLKNRLNELERKA